MQSNYRFIKNTLLPSLALGSTENIALILVDFVLIIYIYIYLYDFVCYMDSFPN